MKRDRRRTFAAIDALEPRQVPADIGIGTTTSIDSRSVRVEFTAIGEGVPATVPVAIYRSVDGVFDAGLDALIAEGTIAPAAGGGAGPQASIVAVPGGLTIRPMQDFVITVIDPANTLAEDNEGNNVDAFRTFAIGAVTHGYQPDGQVPAWIGQVADGLRAEGYDAAIPFDWAGASALPLDFADSQAAGRMAEAVGTAAAALPLGEGDVVDVHLIGHSRGGGVASQAAAFLGAESLPLALRSGYLKLTLLDPHPAANRPEIQTESASFGPIGRHAWRLYRGFQAATADEPIAIAANVDRAEVLYQRAPVQATRGRALDEAFLNSWGTVPVSGAAGYFDLTQAVGSHVGIYEYFRDAVVPTLSEGGTIGVPEMGMPSVLAGSLARESLQTRPAGLRYERALLRPGVTSRAVAQEVLDRLDRVNSLILADRPGRAYRQINRFIDFVRAGSGRSIAAPVASALLELAARIRLALILGGTS